MPQILDICLREAFKKKLNKLCGNFPQGGGGFEPNPHFFEKNKVGLKMCFKSEYMSEYMEIWFLVFLVGKNEKNLRMVRNAQKMISRMFFIVGYFPRGVENFHTIYFFF